MLDFTSKESLICFKWAMYVTNYRDIWKNLYLFDMIEKIALSSRQIKLI